MSDQFSNLSLYIPHVFPNYEREDVISVFEENIGKVKNVDFVLKSSQDGKHYNSAYIHFDYWYDTVSARNFQARVLDPKTEARIVYDEPWYWIVLENKARKHIPGERKPRIEIADLKTPEKSVVTETIPLAPVKVATKLVSALEPVKLESEFAAVSAPAPAAALEENDEFDHEFIELINEMASCEDFIEEIDANLISVDSKYLETLEHENAELHNYNYQLNLRIQELNALLYSEQIKSQALAEAIQLVSKSMH